MIVTTSRQELDPSLLKKRKKEQSRGTDRSYIPLDREEGSSWGISPYAWTFLLPLALFLFLLGTSLPYVRFPAGRSLRTISLPGEIVLGELGELGGQSEPDHGQIRALRAETGILPPSRPSNSATPEDRRKLWELDSESYRVRENDRPSSLCQRFGLELGTLISINRLESIRSVDTGDNLLIPEIDGILYSWEEGDTLDAILERFGCDEREIIYYNPGMILVEGRPMAAKGQEIFLPGAALPEQELRRRTGQLYIFPLRGRIIRSYGNYRDPLTQIVQFNNGIDIKGQAGEPVEAALEGTVISAGFNNNYGNFVILDHGNGYKSLYAHLSQISVGRNDKVLQGEVIATVGKTGYAPEEHLHFSLFKGKKSVDPMDYLH